MNVFAPERLLDESSDAGDQRLKDQPTTQRAAQGLILVNPHKRLLSPLEAFRRRLCGALQRAAEAEPTEPSAAGTQVRIPPDTEDENA